MADLYKTALRSEKNSVRFALDVEIALLVQLVFAFFSYGFRPVLLVLLSVVSAIFCELIGNAARHQKPTVFDGTALVTGTIIGLLMSPITAYWVPMLASAFAIVVVKIPFGGVGRNVFNPAAAGVALATQCFSKRVLTYPDVTLAGTLPLGEIPKDIVTRLSPAAELADGAVTNFTFSDALWGEIPGAIGTTALLLLAAAAVFLFMRRTASPLITLPYLAACAVFTLCFPRSAETNVLYNITLELCSGHLLFAGIFMFTDPVTAPRFGGARVVYGALSGLLVMLMRYFGRFEEGAVFAVLIMNAFASPLDRGCWYLARFWRKRRAVKRGETV